MIYMINKKNIFNEISPSANDIFSGLNQKDLEYLLSLINMYKLTLRDKINVSLIESFGLEIECENARWDKIARRIESEWELTDDMSLLEGAEIKSPILTDTEENWLALKRICSMLSKYSIVGQNSGGHVHIGVQALGNDLKSLINFLKLWAVYEPIIYRFSYGEFLGPRPGLKDTAKSVQVDFINLCSFCEEENVSEKELIHYLSDDKYKAVNFKHYNTFRTLEFRCPNATLNPVIWQNNVNLFVKMMNYAKRSDFNNQLFDTKRKRIFIDCKKPNEIYVDDALEFADLIFDNNLDKIYFLRQYLKSFEKSDYYESAKSFS